MLSSINKVSLFYLYFKVKKNENEDVQKFIKCRNFSNQYMRINIISHSFDFATIKTVCINIFMEGVAKPIALYHYYVTDEQKRSIFVPGATKCNYMNMI